MLLKCVFRSKYEVLCFWSAWLLLFTWILYMPAYIVVIPYPGTICDLIYSAVCHLQFLFKKEYMMKPKQDIQLSENFLLSEFTASETAEKLHIANIPSLRDIARLKELCVNLLQPIRTAYGEPIKVTSGYRSLRLNNAVGGVKASAHLVGYAADIKPSKGSVNDFIEWLKEFIPKSGLKYDQIIIETKKKSKWVHVGYKNQLNLQRMQLFNLNVK